MPTATKTKKSPVNQEYLKEWDAFAASKKRKHPILMPAHVDIVDGKIVRNRMKSGEVKKIFARCKDEFPHYMQRAPELFDNPKQIISDYCKYFDKIDGVEGPGEPTPLDINIDQPTWMMYNLPRKNWKFSKARQYSVENDCDDQCRNFVKICTLDNRNVLIMENRNRSNPKGLKFNLHVAISQTVDGHRMVTDIIIDPGSGQIPQPPFDPPP